MKLNFRMRYFGLKIDFQASFNFENHEIVVPPKCPRPLNLDAVGVDLQCLGVCTCMPFVVTLPPGERVLSGLKDSFCILSLLTM